MSPCCIVLTFFISKPHWVHHQSWVATDSTSWDYQDCTRDTLWHRHYVRTSKEYLINCHILLQYFELVFLQLQLVKISCKLIIIWVNYEKKQKGVPFLWNTVYKRKAELSHGLCSRQQTIQAVTRPVVEQFVKIKTNWCVNHVYQDTVEEMQSNSAADCNFKRVPTTAQYSRATTDLGGCLHYMVALG